jgi:hypothetical protein
MAGENAQNRKTAVVTGTKYRGCCIFKPSLKLESPLYFMGIANKFPVQEYAFISDLGY